MQTYGNKTDRQIEIARKTDERRNGQEDRLINRLSQVNRQIPDTARKCGSLGVIYGDSVHSTETRLGTDTCTDRPQQTTASILFANCILTLVHANKHSTC